MTFTAILISLVESLLPSKRKARRRRNRPSEHPSSHGEPLRKKQFWLLAGVFVAIVVALDWFLNPPPRHPPTASTPVVPHKYVERKLTPTTPAMLDAAIQRSGEYLRKRCQSSGQFVYRTHLNHSSPDTGVRYNMLRHAGAIYALGMYHRWKRDERVADTMVRAGAFLKSSIAPIQVQPLTLAIWSDPETTGSDSEPECKLGGTGLGLVALLTIERVQPGFTTDDELEQLGEFVLFMQRDDGSFYSKYLPSQEDRDDSWVSLYYPGEAALGLLMLYEHTGDAKWLEGAVSALMYLSIDRADAATVPADHWALLATAKLLGYSPSATPDGQQTVLVRHAVDICRSILKEQVDDKTALAGGFSSDGRTTPTATRLEGLIAALSFLSAEEHAELCSDIQAAVQRGVSFLLASQVVAEPQAGAIPRAIGMYEKPSTVSQRAFNRRAGEVRIDYVQHALSALIARRELDTDSGD